MKYLLQGFASLFNWIKPISKVKLGTLEDDRKALESDYEKICQDWITVWSDGSISIDRDKIVAYHIESLRKMRRPGNPEGK